MTVFHPEVEFKLLDQDVKVTLDPTEVRAWESRARGLNRFTRVHLGFYQIEIFDLDIDPDEFARVRREINERHDAHCKEARREYLASKAAD